MEDVLKIILKSHTSYERSFWLTVSKTWLAAIDSLIPSYVGVEYPYREMTARGDYISIVRHSKAESLNLDAAYGSCDDDIVKFVHETAKFTYQYDHVAEYAKIKNGILPGDLSQPMELLKMAIKLKKYNVIRDLVCNTLMCYHHDMCNETEVINALFALDDEPTATHMYEYIRCSCGDLSVQGCYVYKTARTLYLARHTKLTLQGVIDFQLPFTFVLKGAALAGNRELYESVETHYSHVFHTHICENIVSPNKQMRDNYIASKKEYTIRDVLFACKLGDISLVKKFMNQLQSHIITNNCMSILRVACEYGNLEMVKAVMQTYNGCRIGYNIKVADYKGMRNDNHGFSYKIDCHGKLDVCKYLCSLNFEVCDYTGSIEIERVIIKHKSRISGSRAKFWHNNMATCCFQ